MLINGLIIETTVRVKQGNGYFCTVISAGFYSESRISHGFFDVMCKNETKWMRNCLLLLVLT